MHAEGGSDIKFLSIYAGPERAMWADATPRREMKIQKGSLIQFDGGCTYDGYHTDIKRFACLGEPTKEQYRFYEIARSSEQAAIDAVVPEQPTEKYTKHRNKLYENQDILNL